MKNCIKERCMKKFLEEFYFPRSAYGSKGELPPEKGWARRKHRRAQPHASAPFRSSPGDSSSLRSPAASSISCSLVGASNAATRSD